MKTPYKILLEIAALAVFSSAAHAATLIYGFDDATAYGKTVLVMGDIAATNISSTNKTFDTSIYTTGTASLKLTGTAGSNFGYFSTPIKIGLVSTGGSVQDLNSTSTNISFQYRIANSPEFTHDLYGSGDPNIRIRLYASSDGSGNHVADYYTTANAGNTGGSFLTLSTALLATPSTLASGWSFGSGYGVSDLASIGSMRIILGYSYSTTINSTAIEYHLDDLQVSGNNVTIPESSASTLILLGGLFLLGCRRIDRRRALCS